MIFKLDHIMCAQKIQTIFSYELLFEWYSRKWKFL